MGGPSPGAEREAVSRVNFLCERVQRLSSRQTLVSQLLCALRRLRTCGPWISTVVCSTYVPRSSTCVPRSSTCVPRMLSWIGLVLVADCDDARPSGAGKWTFRPCYRGASRVVMSAVFQISPIRRVKLELQGISLTRGVCETRWILGSSVPGNTHYCVDGVPAASQSLNTGSISQ